MIQVGELQLRLAEVVETATKGGKNAIAKLEVTSGSVLLIILSLTPGEDQGARDGARQLPDED